MAVNGTKSLDMLPPDHLEHTLETDIRGFLADKPELLELASALDGDKSSDTNDDMDDPRVGTELTDTQVLDLLHGKSSNR